MIEKAYTLGEKKNLVGILHAPDQATHKDDHPAILFLNAGLLHRVGPFRFNVEMSRLLASSGYYTIRFDVSGVGDSFMLKDFIEYTERIKRDVIEVMDFLEEKYGVARFILVGLCSGAENAHAVAAADHRVSGIVMIDGFTYPTFFYYLRDYAPYFLNPFRLLKSILKRIKRLFIPLNKEAVSSQMFVRQFPPQKQIAQEISEMILRDVRILNIYSGEITGYNYARQYLDMFKSVNFMGKMKLLFFKDADHTFSSIAERKNLMDCICNWIEDKHTVMEKGAVDCYIK